MEEFIGNFTENLGEYIILFISLILVMLFAKIIPIISKKYYNKKNVVSDSIENSQTGKKLLEFSYDLKKEGFSKKFLNNIFLSFPILVVYNWSPESFYITLVFFEKGYLDNDKKFIPYNTFISYSFEDTYQFGKDTIIFYSQNSPNSNKKKKTLLPIPDYRKQEVLSLLSNYLQRV